MLGVQIEPEQFVSIPWKSGSLLYVLLLLTIALTVEEGIHLLRHPQGWPPDNITSRYHPGCSLRNTDSRVLQCPVDGYNSALFLCSELSCRFKEPANGLHITPYEERIWDTYMVKHTQGYTLEDSIRNRERGAHAR